MTNKELLLEIDRRIRDRVCPEGKVLYEHVRGEIDRAIWDLDYAPIKAEKFIFVEDGSVDTDELIETLSMSNPEIKVIVYRAGARPPELVEVK